MNRPAYRFTRRARYSFTAKVEISRLTADGTTIPTEGVRDRDWKSPGIGMALMPRASANRTARGKCQALVKMPNRGAEVCPSIHSFKCCIS